MGERAGPAVFASTLENWPLFTDPPACLPVSLPLRSTRCLRPSISFPGDVNHESTPYRCLNSGPWACVWPYRKVFLAVDRIVLNAVLGHVKGNQAQASELLGISRTTLRAKLRSLGMAIEKQLLLETDQDDH